MNERNGTGPRPPNILFVMTDSQRADTIAALGNPHIYTPNLDRLVRRGAVFERAYTTCPVCVPARYTIRTGCEPATTCSFANVVPEPPAGLPAKMEERCGEYLAKTMRRLGYRTFGIGKFHPKPWDEDLGFDLYQSVGDMLAETGGHRNPYAAWLAQRHPEYDFVEGLMGERTEMFYMPQMRPLPPAATLEWWTADQAISQIKKTERRPYFGFVSFVPPHPPFAPPVPFNRMYDPDRVPDFAGGDIATDHMDASLVAMNRALWAEEMSPTRAKILKARYYGSVSFVDHCLGRILDAVEAGGEADNTLIAFFTDHGDNLGDHHLWHINSYFDTVCRIPFLVSWPARIAAGQRRRELACLSDLFGIATGAAGVADLRQGVDLLAMLEGKPAAPRKSVVGFSGRPGRRFYKMMVRSEGYKYVFFANGGREQLFDLDEDPAELRNLAAVKPVVAREHRAVAVAACRVPGAAEALDGDDLRVFPFAEIPPRRIYQFEHAPNVKGFPADPAGILREYREAEKS